VADLQRLLEAAVRAPNGGNRQIARFLAVTDRARITRFGELYHEAWWAKRRDELGRTGPADVPPEATNYRAAMALADHMREVPCVALAFAEPPGWAHSVLPACQNLMLAARALGIGSIPTTPHPSVMARVYALFALRGASTDTASNRSRMPSSISSSCAWRRWSSVPQTARSRPLAAFGRNVLCVLVGRNTRRDGRVDRLVRVTGVRWLVRCLYRALLKPDQPFPRTLARLVRYRARRRW
jgi:Nitroreductase family